MRTVDYTQIVESVRQMCLEANTVLPPDVEEALAAAARAEASPVGRDVLRTVLESAAIAKAKPMAICQDTGMVVVLAELGQDVHITGGLLTDAINEGVRQGYEQFYFRKSVVEDPLLRVNTGDNTPAVVHISLVPGDRLRLLLAPKGFGSENMSAVKMLKPAEGEAGVKQFVVQAVSQAGGNPCPPIIVGVGLGGTMEQAALLAKRALFRPIGQRSPKDHLARLERELLELVNKTGVGPMGFGGTQTALEVFVESYPTHIAGLPVAVNINCHAARHSEVVL
ncbi:MAG: fumarate hydratase [Firmicutes bacterium]|jgi:fumarate hydratase subunit alpha|nr:fumarate hydratase [Bacillota bacterium]